MNIREFYENNLYNDGFFLKNPTSHIIFRSDGWEESKRKKKRGWPL